MHTVQHSILPKAEPVEEGSKSGTLKPKIQAAPVPSPPTLAKKASAAQKQVLKVALTVRLLSNGTGCYTMPADVIMVACRILHFCCGISRLRKVMCHSFSPSFALVEMMTFF